MIERRIEVEVTYKGERRMLKIDDDSTVEDLLRSLHLYVDAHIVTALNRPLPLTHRLQGGERITVIQVASGG